MELTGGRGVDNTTATNNTTTATNGKGFHKAWYLNQLRISSCCDRLAVHLRTAPKNDPVDFFNLCLSLARGIGYAIANKEVSDRALELPSLLKQVCKLRNDSFLHAAILPLMISVKSACENKWFANQDSEGLCSLANEILGSFCSTMNFTTEANSFLSIISTIMSRYYPKMKIGEILAFLEVKHGYGTYVHDFLISKDMKPSPEESIRLFTIQMDNTETSSCLITPTKANFLLNGIGVDRRNNVSMDTGPQMPTSLHNLLKYGVNLLQAVGQFTGNYIVVVAFMSMVSTPDHSTLQDYVQPSLPMVDPDSEIVEGPSKISLNCPISLKRINFPVKGHMCKHLQCFDYENYMEINSRRPLWRCPHCNQHVCFSDICIDRNMAEILKEVGETVNDVIISSDGSWKVIMEYEHSEKPQDTLTSGQDETAEPDCSSFSNGLADILDITVDDYEVDTFKICDMEMVSPTNYQSLFDVQNMTANSLARNTIELNQNIAAQIEDDFWSGNLLPTYGSGASSSRSESQIGNVSEPALYNLLSSVLSDARSPLTREPGSFHGNAIDATSVHSVPEREISSSNSLQPQQFQFGNTTRRSEYGYKASMSRNANRTPITVQATSAPTPTSTLSQRPRDDMNVMVQSSGSIASQTSIGLGTFPANMEIQQLLSRKHSNPLQGSSLNSLTSQRYPDTQTVGLQAPSQTQSSYKVSSVLLTKHQSSGQQSSLSMRPGLNQSPVLMRPSTSFSSTQTYQGGSQTVIGQATGAVDSPQAQAMVSAPEVARAAKRARATSPYGLNMDGLRTPTGRQRDRMAGARQAMTSTDVPVDLPAERDWRPTGRMRGSLSGRAYSNAFNQFIIRPTQQGQTARPTSNVTPSLRSASSQMDILMANRTALAQAGNYPFTGLASTSGGSTVLPRQSSGMNQL